MAIGAVALVMNFSTNNSAHGHADGHGTSKCTRKLRTVPTMEHMQRRHTTDMAMRLMT